MALLQPPGGSSSEGHVSPPSPVAARGPGLSVTDRVRTTRSSFVLDSSERRSLLRLSLSPRRSPPLLAAARAREVTRRRRKSGIEKLPNASGDGVTYCCCARVLLPLHFVVVPAATAPPAPTTTTTAAAATAAACFPRGLLRFSAAAARPLPLAPRGGILLHAPPRAATQGHGPSRCGSRRGGHRRRRRLWSRRRG